MNRSKLLDITVTCFKNHAPKDADQNKDEILFRKVKVKALDMDWLFHENNIRVLMCILADCSD